MVGISQSTYSELENNQESATLGMLNKIADILDKSPLDLLELNNQPIINMYNNETANGIVNNNIDTELLKNLSTALIKFIDYLEKNKK
jgi:transcriptional regulator with XRE-family HTH domain